MIEKVFETIISILYKVLIITICIMLGVQIGIHYQNKKTELDNMEYVLEWLERTCPEKKGEVIHFGLPDGRLIKIRTIREKNIGRL